VRDIDESAILGHVTRDGGVIDGDRKGAVDELLARAQSFLKGIVLRMAESELILPLEVDGSGVGIEKLSCVGEDSFQEHIKVFDLIDIQADSGDQIYFFLFAQHVAVAFLMTSLEADLCRRRQPVRTKWCRI
jgi:hypothetical protein